MFPQRCSRGKGIKAGSGIRGRCGCMIVARINDRRSRGCSCLDVERRKAALLRSCKLMGRAWLDVHALHMHVCCHSHGRVVLHRESVGGSAPPRQANTTTLKQQCLIGPVPLHWSNPPRSGVLGPRALQGPLLPSHTVQWSEDVIKADPFFGRSRVRFRVPPWVSNAIARGHLA